MKLIYISSAIYPSQLANRIQTLEMWKAMYRALKENFLIAVPKNSVLKEVQLPVLYIPGPLASPLFAWRVAQLIKKEQATHVFCREERLLFFVQLWLKFLKYQPLYIFEAHWVLKDFFFNSVIKSTDFIVAITDSIKTELGLMHSNSERILVAPDGVDLSKYENLPTKKEVRERYNIPGGVKVIGYTGSVGVHDWKGVDMLLKVSRSKPDDWFIWIVGGKESVIEMLRDVYPAVRFEGYVEHSEVPAIQSACDVLILPNKSGNLISEKYTSPLKLFEYMASGTPIIASDLPSIKSILSDDLAILVSPNSEDSLTDAIKLLFNNAALSNRLSNSSKLAVKNMSGTKG